MGWLEFLCRKKSAQAAENTGGMFTLLAESWHGAGTASRGSGPAGVIRAF
jgi:hypothetical protein